MHMQFLNLDFTCISIADIGGIMIQCSNDKCGNGKWFHLSCLNMAEVDVPENEWWCSDECRCKGLFCFCKTDQASPFWVECERQEDCPNGQYFHPDCVGLTKETIPGSYNIIRKISGVNLFKYTVYSETQYF